MQTYDIIIIDECGDACTYWTGFKTDREARTEMAKLMAEHPEWYEAYVEPSRKEIYRQAWQDRFDNDTQDLY
jgi:hypothetical protein